VSHLACLNGINANQISMAKTKQYEEGSLTAVTAGEEVVPASGLAAANKPIRQRLLGKKTMEAERLKEAVEFGRAKNELRMRPCCPGTRKNRRLPKYGCAACATESQGSPVA
jgi:transposase